MRFRLLAVARDIGVAILQETLVLLFNITEVSMNLDSGRTTQSVSVHGDWMKEPWIRFAFGILF
jgi:hypothetical protein